jgi:hypothetical protein
MRQARRVAVLLSILLMPFASAQTTATGAFAAGAVNQLITVVNSKSAAQIAGILKSGGSIRTGLTGLGGKIGYGGAAQIGGMAIVGALNYFYNTVKDQATGTPLDTYYSPDDHVDICHAFRDGSWYVTNHDPYTQLSTMDQAKESCATTFAASIASLQRDFNAFPKGVNRQEWHPANEDPAYANSYQAYFVYPNPSQTLTDFVTTNAPAAEGVKTAIGKYLADQLAANPDALPSGVEVTPAPNTNQIAGDAVNPNIDTDHDGYTDAAELAAGTNPNSALSHPDTAAAVPTEEATCTAQGGTWAVGACTMPPRPEPYSGAGCGDFSFSRLTHEPGGFMHDLIFPCGELSDFMQPLIESAKTKFPFSLTNNLSNLVNYSGGTDAGEVLPSHLGPFTLDWAWIAPLITTVGLLFKAFTTYLMIDFILSKLSGQVVLK